MSPTMSALSRKELLSTMSYHYERATSKRERGVLLDQLCRCTGWERKYAIKMLRGHRGPLKAGGKSKARRGGSRARYGPVEVAVLKALWLLAEQPCGKRLKAVVGLWLPSWERRHGELEEDTRQRLLDMSAAQMDRLLGPFRVRGSPKRPAPGCEVRAQVPVRTGEWEVHEPGWLEADTVAHCGGSMRGCFTWSVVLTDIHTQWTEARAIWNRSDRVVHQRMEQMEAVLPFAILGMDTDNGGEFLNGALWRYWRQRERPVEMTRSRPYCKNDNAHVEQKNRTHIRQLLGYDRLAHQALVEPLNEVLELWSRWNNLYSPTLKLKSKQREGAKVRKVHEKQARTPCQRMLEHEGLARAARASLQELLESSDPIELKQQIEEKLKAWWRLEREMRATQVFDRQDVNLTVNKTEPSSPLGGRKVRTHSTTPKHQTQHLSVS